MLSGEESEGADHKYDSPVSMKFSEAGLVSAILKSNPRYAPHRAPTIQILVARVRR